MNVSHLIRLNYPTKKETRKESVFTMANYEFFKFLIDHKAIIFPFISIAISMIFKAISTPNEINRFKRKEFLHFGLSLVNSGLMTVVTAVCSQAQLTVTTSANDMGRLTHIPIFMIAIYIPLALTYTLSFRYFGWDKAKKTIKTGWIVSSNIIGIALFLLSVCLFG